MIEPDEDEAEAPESTPHEIVPPFTPVPREKNRHNGWNPEVQRRFVEALAETGSVTAAARAVGRAQRGAYELRRHPQAEEFRRAWDAALDIAVRMIEDGAMDRAINGVQVPVYSKGGELVGWRAVHNERLTTFILQARAPERFGGLRKAHGAKGENAVDKMELNRLKKQWRKEWERERFEESVARSNKNIETFAGMITGRHIRWWAELTPRARQAYLTFRRIESEDSDARRCPDDGWNRENSELAIADFEDTYPDDGRAKIDRLIEADGLADDAVLGEDLPPRPAGRMIQLRDDGWFEPAR